MGAFNVAVAVEASDTYDGAKLTAAVAKAMAPYGPDGTRSWTWYAFGITGSGIFAYIAVDGDWVQESDTWLPYEEWIASLKQSGFVAIHLRCKF